MKKYLQSKENTKIQSTNLRNRGKINTLIMQIHDGSRSWLGAINLVQYTLVYVK